LALEKIAKQRDLRQMEEGAATLEHEVTRLQRALRVIRDKFLAEKV
jgi:hypothetical protein